MSTLLRLIKIFHCIAKYQLIDLLPTSHTRRIKIYLFPYALYPKNTSAEGLRLRLALEELGPIFIKFGQLLSTRPDLFPEHIIVELTHLQDKVPPFDTKEYRRLIEAAIGEDINTAFLDIDEQPLASASIAQVHAAKLKDGRDVVIKAVRPNIEKIIEQDTQLLTLLARIAQRVLNDGERLRPVEVVQDYKETIFDELDLMKEAANASQLRRNFENDNTLYIPEIHWPYCRRNVLVMERIHGIPVNDISRLEAQKTNLKQLAERGVEIFFKQVFEHNFFHADMHPGNVFVSYDTPEKPSYIAVDMAIVGSLNREDQYYLARNMIAMFRRDYRQVAELHVQSGWVPKGTSVASFESAIRSVCEPIFQKPLKDISFGEALISLFHTAQRFNMPVQPQLVLLQKTLLNIEGLGRQLYPELDLWDTAHPYLEAWLKRRLSPKTIWKDLKYHAPEWIEKYPQIPGLIFDTVSEVKRYTELTPELRATQKRIEDIESMRLRKKKWLGLSFVSAAILMHFYLPSTFQLSREATVAALIIASAVLVL